VSIIIEDYYDEECAYACMTNDDRFNDPWCEIDMHAVPRKLKDTID
jgi:hypothetical protein